MIRDKQNIFSDEQALTGDAISNVIDLGPLGTNTVRDIGAGEPLYFHCLVTTTLDSAGEAATLDVTLESDSVVGLDDSATVHLTVPQVAEATLAAGYWIAKGIPLPSGAYERYLGVRYNNGTEVFTSGKVSAWISNNRFDDRVYESAITTGVN